ncbi:MAG: hypothetical protein E7370_03035 [Clostridiales bacterium]|nr:hypothetical protein [Clostridiales bacterium]
MKKIILKTTCTILALLIIPVALFIIGLTTPQQFGATYYGVLPKMVERLKTTEGKRIVVVGNSAVAFGVNGELIESEIEGYTVCPFGLYGAVGTKAMMDLSRENIKEGDIVILAPEQGAQSLSLYFNGETLWKCLDGNFDLLTRISFDDIASMIGSYPAFISQKFGYLSTNSAPVPEGVYAASSFNERLDMIYDRPYNQMLMGFDSVERVSYDKSVMTAEFSEYVNEYNDFVTSKGATLLYGFCPINIQGVMPNTTEEDIDAFYDFLDETLNCEILGSPHNYLFDSDWFYDSNVHVNTAGSVVYTRQLVQDIKVYLGDSSKTEIVIPEKPVVPEEDVTGEDGKDAALFEYEETSYGYNIVALTEAGKQVTSIEIPDFYNGKKVLAFGADVFAGNTLIQEIHIGKNIKSILDDSFNGCTSLKSIYMSKEAKASDCAVYSGLFNGVTGCKIYVPKAEMTNYINDYWWGRHGSFIEAY